jgi:4-hydroxybenzoate polyprenyltransferase
MENIQSRAGQGRVADAPSGHWVYRALPRAIWPYAQLARWDRPIGWWLLLWPCWWSAALAASAYAEPGAPLWSALPSPWHLLLFLAGAIAMRGAGCTYNDIVDRDLDAGVARTRTRPIPAGQVTVRQAQVFLVAQALVGLLVLLQFNGATIGLGVLSLVTVAVYPFLKRITWWPQVGLGLAFSWGALVGWTAETGTLGWPPLLLYAAAILWTIGYDTIYAHQDKEDDALIGVHSTARLFAGRSVEFIRLFYAGATLLLTVAFVVVGAGIPAYAGLLLGAFHMIWQTRTLKIDDPDNCLKLFRSNREYGLIVFAGIVADALLRTLG